MSKSSEEYEKYAKLFWELQQKKTTPEEEKYMKLCNDLQLLSEDFRDELNELATTNQELQEKLANAPNIAEEKERLEEEDQILKQILKTYN